MQIEVFMWILIIVMHTCIIVWMNTEIRVKAVIGVAVSATAAIIYFRYPENPIAMYILLVLPVFYLGLAGIYRVQKEKRLFTGMESKVRVADDVIRKKYEKSTNIFRRCVITLPKEGDIKGKPILILPQMPFALHKVDYNGNCINDLGRYDEIGWLHNFAPYNELADNLARLGYLVIRMDMIGGCGNEEITDYGEGVLDWVAYIKELFRIEDGPVVIGHRETGIWAVKLMAREKWRTGVLLCCGMDGKYDEEGKSCLDYMMELGEEHSVLHISAGIGRKERNAEGAMDKLKCKYKPVKMENMDISLREGKSRNVSEKGYGILCGTGSFPPVYAGLAEEIAEYSQSL